MTVVPLTEGRQAAVLPRTHKVFLEDLELEVDIGFHDFEVGAPQRLLATVSVTLDLAHWPASDTQEASWNYDIIRTGIIGLIGHRRFNLQETLARAIYDLVAARAGVKALRVSTCKPDIYPDCAGVGVELASF